MLLISCLRVATVRPMYSSSSHLYTGTVDNSSKQHTVLDTKEDERESKIVYIIPSSVLPWSTAVGGDAQQRGGDSCTCCIYLTPLFLPVL